jgi:protocatechuate 3,4-dioxygenase beta subunit
VHRAGVRRAAWGLLVMCAGAVLGAQSGQMPVRDPLAAAGAPANTGQLSGTVVAADTSQPLPGVRVSLSGSAPPLARSATTDAQGRFAFDTLPAGAFTLRASRGGYVDSIWGQRQPGSGRPGTPIQLREGQQIKDLSLPLAKGGVITGRVVDEFGYAAASTPIRVYRAVFRNGERALQQAGTGTTDDRGIYRLFGLVPGEYVVVAAPRVGSATYAVELVRRQAELTAMLARRSAQVAEELAVERARAIRAAAVDPGPSEGYAPVYYPGTPVASMATRVALEVSEEKGGVDFGLQVVPLAHLGGTVSGVSPLPPTLTVYLTEQGPLTGLGTKTARVGSDGRFAFTGVPPGQYQFTVRTALRAAVAVAASAPGQERPRIEPTPSQWMWAQMDLSVGGQSLPDLALTLAPGMSISGTVAFEGSAPPPEFSRVRLSFLPIGSSPSAAEMELASAGARVDGQGRFTAVGLMPGRFRVTASTVPGWRLASVTAQGREALDVPIEVRPGEDVAGLVATFSDRSTTLEGMLQNAEGGPAADYTVVVFAADNRFWMPFSRRIQAARPSSDGRYSFRNLPPGEYRLAAVVDPEPDQWFDPEFLRAIVAASTPVTLGEGEARTQDLRIGR